MQKKYYFENTKLDINYATLWKGYLSYNKSDIILIQLELEDMCRYM